MLCPYSVFTVEKLLRIPQVMVAILAKWSAADAFGVAGCLECRICTSRYDALVAL